MKKDKAVEYICTVLLAATIRGLIPPTPDLGDVIVIAITCLIIEYIKGAMKNHDDKNH